MGQKIVVGMLASENLKQRSSWRVFYDAVNIQNQLGVEL